MDPFLGEIRAFSFGIVPRGWLSCSGQILPISHNAALFSLLGIQYGGDGVNTFALPDLRGRAAISQSPQYLQGSAAGTETVTISATSLPSHTHVASATSSTANAPNPNSGILAVPADSTFAIYGPAQSLVPIAPASLGQTGGSMPHNNVQPYLVLNYCIAIQGIFPSRQ
jgi:microcystin-dependent protein